MRHPLYTDRLSQDERSKVRKLLARVITFYFSVALLIIGGMMFKAKFLDRQTVETQQEAGAFGGRLVRGLRQKTE